MSNRVPSVEVPYVIHGSFNRFLDEIEGTITTLNSTGLARAIAPHNCEAAGSQNGFVLLAGEEGKHPLQIEAEYLRKVLQLKAVGGFSLYVTPGGYIGKSAAYEAGIIQATGTRVFFTETPEDIPFYVDPSSVKSAEQLAEELRQNNGVLDPFVPDADPIANLWDRLPFPTALVAVGGIVACQNRILLVEDGRWGDKLTVPGTTVRARETRDGALKRALQDKFGLNINDVAPLDTSFMIADSGYAGDVDVSDLVFDDRAITATSERARPQNGLRLHWVSPSEVHALLNANQIEPNAAKLLTGYLVGTAA